MGRTSLVGFLGGLCFLSASCGGSPAMRAASSGDLKALRNEIVAREKSGDLTNDEAASLGKVIAERELRGTKPEDVLQRVRDTRACAPELDDVLGDRMKTHDAAGAEAALTLMEAGKLDDDDARAFVDDPDDRWRAIGARTLSRAQDRGARLRAILDPSPLVRRSAMRAAATASEPADRDALSEAARLDPEPIVRTEAIRALARLGMNPEGTSPWTATIIGRMRDLWATSDDAIREDIASAYAMPGLYEAGGHDAIAVLIASGHGPGVIAGAGAVLRAHPNPEDTQLRQSAVALLVRTIATGSRRDRLHAIAIAPTTVPDLAEAIRKVAKSDEEGTVRVAALGRLVALPPDRAEAVQALERMAGQKDDPSLGSRARLALAIAGDLRVQAWIEADLSAPDPQVRLSAVDALAALGRSARGAPLLADSDPAVRTRTACTLMVAARTPRITK